MSLLSDSAVTVRPEGWMGRGRQWVNRKWMGWTHSHMQNSSQSAEDTVERVRDKSWTAPYEWPSYGK